MCSVPKPERPEKARKWVLEYFQGLGRPDATLTTSLGTGPGGFGHGPQKRKLYYKDLVEALAKNGCNCRMKSLKPSSFGDTPKNATVDDIADMVAKDLG